jgi:2-methylcitrate dehydratase PrpD
LAELILGLRFEDIPDEVVNRAVQSALDFFGVAIGASQHPLVEKMARLSAALGSPAQATVIGRKERRDALWAALINGSMAHILDSMTRISPPFCTVILLFWRLFGVERSLVGFL